MQKIWKAEFMYYFYCIKFKTKKSTTMTNKIQSTHIYKGITFTIDSYPAPGGRGSHHIANGIINGYMVSKSSSVKKNLKRSFQRRIDDAVL